MCRAGSGPLRAIGRAFGLAKSVEIAYASEMLQRTIGLPGVVELSPFDLSLFVPPPAAEKNHRAQGLFTVGRLSRDNPHKHHPADVPVYQNLACAEGVKLRLMGAESLAPQLDKYAAIELLPANAEPAHTFLQSLDCFYYGTAEDFTETFGRVVFEAMACGLPVVCHRRGGYADFIRHGENGFLFDTREEGLGYVMALRDDPALRAQIGATGRQTVLQMFSPEKRKEIIDFYIR
jgi:glycosyltransferase involved in cell wall biosynthesis